MEGVNRAIENLLAPLEAIGRLIFILEPYVGAGSARVMIETGKIRCDSIG